MYFFIIILYIIIFVDSFVINFRGNQLSTTHFKKQDYFIAKYKDKYNLLYSKDEKGEEGNLFDLENQKDNNSQLESQESKNDDYELVEFVKSSTEGEELSQSKLKISKKLWKLLTGLLVYRSKFGDYRIENDFVFEKEEKGEYSGYKLGEQLQILLKLLEFKKRNNKIFRKYRERLKRKNNDYLDSDLEEAPKLLWLLGFPTKTYYEESRIHQRLARRDNIITSKMSRLPLFKKIKGSREDGSIESPPEGGDFIKKVKKMLLEDMFEYKKRMKDEMIFSNPQEFPEPTNKPIIRNELLRKIVNEILDKNRLTCTLIKRDTRYETEGGYHYAFFHWSFEQVLQSLVMFNDMYFDYNKDLLIKSERTGDEFKPITFNILKKSWRIPENEYWPKEFHGMPLGLFVDRFRIGDIDAKEHWLRRPVLDHIGFNWGDGLKYLTFTWDKLQLGLLWYINFRGFPIVDLPPDLVIPKTSLVAKFGKPEEIQGLKLGKLFFSAVDQFQILKKYYPYRFKFLHDMGLDLMLQEQVRLGYRPIPHGKFTKIGRDLMVTKDYKYMFDKYNKPPEELKDDVVNIMDVKTDHE